MTDQARHLRDALRALLVAHKVLDSNQRACGAPLSMPHAHALLELRQGPLRVTHLATRLNIDRTNVSRLSQRMEDAGDIARTQDPSDARATLLELTEKGRELADQIDASSAEHFASIVQDLGEETGAVVQALGALERALRATAPLLLVGFAATLIACQPSKPATPSTQDRPSPVSPAQTSPTPAAKTQVSPYDTLNKLDNRIPFTLPPKTAWRQKQNMMEYLVAIQEITDALSREDWDAVAVAAERIEPSPKKHKICAEPMRITPAFKAMGQAFHKHADAIAPAAKKKDASAVLKATSEALKVCTSCHQAYRQDVVDRETWGKIYTEKTGKQPLP